EHIANKVGGARRHRGKDVKRSRYPVWDLYFKQMSQSLVHRIKILFENGLAAVAIGLFDSFFDGCDGVGRRQDAADGEEAGLHDGVDAAPHFCVASYSVGIDDENTQSSLDYLLLEFTAPADPHFGRCKGHFQAGALARERLRLR